MRSSLGIGLVLGLQACAPLGSPDLSIVRAKYGLMRTCSVSQGLERQQVIDRCGHPDRSVTHHQDGEKTRGCLVYQTFAALQPMPISAIAVCLSSEKKAAGGDIESRSRVIGLVPLTPDGLASLVEESG